jgi:DNA-binding NarL/FixJ family response regulator
MIPSESQSIRLLIVDDHKVVRLGLSALLGRYEGLQVVGEAATVAASLQETARLLPDVVLMDVRLPDGNGFDACREIRRSQPQVRVLFLTSFADEEVVLQCIEAGADGYLLKEIDEEVLVRAIRDVAGGQSILDPAVTRRVLERAKGPANPSAADRWQSLSPQERRVLALIAEGKTNKEIGTQLNLSDKTVKNYISNMLEKLQMTRRSQAAAFFVQHASKADQSALVR